MTLAILGYLSMIAFLGIELFGRKANYERPIKAGRPDRGRNFFLGVAFNSSILLSPLLNFIGIGRISGYLLIGLLGVGLMVLGLILRLWAMLTLGKFYTRTLKVSAGQKIVDTGPYRVIRHPGYLGTLLTWIGLPLALSNWVSALLVTLLMAAAYWPRIRAEEAMLVEVYGDEYSRYMQRTKRLIPFVL
jgi:protein-S-isoprenylcysteine O-methyltransferase Ste14